MTAVRNILKHCVIFGAKNSDPTLVPDIFRDGCARAEQREEHWYPSPGRSASMLIPMPLEKAAHKNAIPIRVP